MTLDTQRFFAIKTGMIIVIGTLTGMATRTGHDLPCPWVEDVFTDRMRKLAVPRMALTTDRVHRRLGHGGVILPRGRPVVKAVSVSVGVFGGVSGSPSWCRHSYFYVFPFSP